MEPPKTKWLTPRKVAGGSAVAIAAVLVFLASRSALFNPGRFEAIHPSRGEIVEAVYGLGTVASGQVYSLTVAVPTVVDKVFVPEGTSVRAGDPLVKLLYRATLTAPFDGVVSQLNVYAGEVASSREPILTLIDPTERYVQVSLEQQDALRVRENQRVFLSFEDKPSDRFEGHVAALYPHGQELLARVDVQNLPKTVLPGMTLNVSIEIEHRDNALLVPAGAVVKNEVVVQRNGRRRRIPVTTGLSDKDMVEIVSGDLRTSDTVLLPKK